MLSTGYWTHSLCTALPTGCTHLNPQLVNSVTHSFCTALSTASTQPDGGEGASKLFIVLTMHHRVEKSKIHLCYDFDSTPLIALTSETVIITRMETQLPTWLEQSPDTEDLLTITDGITLPQSLAHRTAALALVTSTYEIIFEDTLEKLADARQLRDIVDDYNDAHSVQLNAGHFLTWIFADKARKAKFATANEVGAYGHLDKSFRIASGVDNPMEDVARSALRVKQHMTAAKIYNKKVFGDDPSTATGGGGGVTVNITGITSPYSRPVTPTIVDDKNLTIDMPASP
jgi:hypothetical protein